MGKQFSLSWVIFVLGVVCIGFVSSAQAEPVMGKVTYTLAWQAPVERENGAALDVSELSHYVLQWSDSLGGSGEVRIDGGATREYQHVRELPLSTEPVKTTYRLKVVDQWGLPSAWSDEATVSSVVAPGAAPAAPQFVSYVHTCNQCTLIVQGASIEPAN